MVAGILSLFPFMGNFPFIKVLVDSDSLQGLSASAFVCGVFLLITVPPVGDFKTKWPQLARITHYFFLLSLDTTGPLHSGFQFSVVLGFLSVQTNESLDVFVSCSSVTHAIQTQLGRTPLSSHSLSSLQIKHFLIC